MKNKNINLLIILIIIVVVILYRFIFFSKNKNGFLDEMREREIKSTVYRKTIDFENHGIPYVIYGEKDSIIIYRDWEKEIEIGDSIIKEKGSLEILFKNFNKIEKLSYDNQDIGLPSP